MFPKKPLKKNRLKSLVENKEKFQQIDQVKGAVLILLDQDDKYG